MNSAPLTPEAIREELERVRADFHALVTEATPADLRRPSSGTRWTNGQLLFHMFFGYLIVRRLLPLVRLMGRLPDRSAAASPEHWRPAPELSTSSTTRATGVRPG